MVINFNSEDIKKGSKYTKSVYPVKVVLTDSNEEFLIDTTYNFNIEIYYCTTKME